MKGKKIAVVLLLVLFAATLMPSITFAQQAVPNGPWVDEITFQAQSDNSEVLSMLANNVTQIHLSDMNDPTIYSQILKNPNLATSTAYGLYFELTFNPYGSLSKPTFDDGSLNPFCDPKIREAMNWLIDRNYISEELLGGLAKPKLFCLTSAFPEYGKIADKLMPIEAEYSYNFDKAKQVIFEEMTTLGATYSEGKWLYNNKPVVIKLIIRKDDTARTKIGNYVADQLELVGFATDRQYKTSREASPIWRGVTPPVSAGAYHIYTAGWITTAVERDSSSNFGFFYTPLGASTGPLWLAYKPDPLFQEIADKLYTSNWTSFDERESLMVQAAEMSLKDSVRVWVVDQVIPYAYRSEIQVASDLASGLFANPISSRTIRYAGKIGGTVAASAREVFVDPWNPISGTNWAMDANIILPTVDQEYIMNPYTGLPMANRIVNATVDVLTGEQVMSSSSWCKLNFVPSITVPTDAWYDWNSTTEQPITAPAGTTANARVTVNYGDPIGTVKYHDGSVMSLADWVVTWGLDFERNDPKSVFYDDSSAPDFAAFKDIFRGWKIDSVHPLVIEYYVNYKTIDAELIFYEAVRQHEIDSPTTGLQQFWPSMPWQAKAIGMLAEEKGLLAFSSSKAQEKNVEWMSYIGGPSLDTLANCLSEALSTGYLPFKQFASKYVTAADAQARYTNLQNWYNTHHTFWVGNGPFYLDSVDFTGHVAVIKAFRDYTYKADRWASLASAPIPVTSVQVPTSVVPGLKANFNLSLTDPQGQPYSNDRMDFVKYVVVDSKGVTRFSGSAVAAAQGKWAIGVNETTSAALSPGTYTLTTIALSKDVAVAGVQKTPFIVIPELSYFSTLLAQTKADLSTSISSVDASLSDKISSLQGSINTMQTTMYAAIGLAIIALLIAIYATAIKKR
jgi:peptide/nickel transport system substrate-binding protein